MSKVVCYFRNGSVTVVANPSKDALSAINAMGPICAIGAMGAMLSRLTEVSISTRDFYAAKAWGLSQASQMFEYLAASHAFAAHIVLT